MAELAVTSAPRVVAQPGWTPCEPFPDLEGRRLFISGGSSGSRFRIAYFRRESDGHLVGRAWFGPETEGPPGHAHGGAVAAVLDEALGAAAWVNGHKIVIARLATDFRQMVPLGTDAIIDTWIHRVEGRKVFTHGRLTDLVHRGKQGTFDQKLGWHRHGSVTWEWIESLAGPTVYDEHLKAHGEGFHHFAFDVPDMDEACAAWEALGVPIVQSGGWGEKGKPGSGRFAYAATDAFGGVTTEFLWNLRR